MWIGIVFGEANNPTKMSQWIFDAYEKKIALAQKIKEKKIVIVAGSNALFGINSRKITEAFDTKTINMGVNAGIELPLVLHLSKKAINTGDTVLIPLEYPMYSYDGTAGLQMIDYILSREIKYFFKLSFYEQFYILWHVSVKRVWDGYFHQSTQKVTKGLYGAHHIDNNGDQINTTLKYRSDWMYNEIQNNYAVNAKTYGKEFDRDAIGWEYIQKFVDYCKEKNATVIFLPTTILKHEDYFKIEKEKWFYENIATEVKKRGWKFVGEPYKYMYEKDYFFDTNFHLIDKARDIRTMQMIEDLKKSSI